MLIQVLLLGWNTLHTSKEYQEEKKNRQGEEKQTRVSKYMQGEMLPFTTSTSTTLVHYLRPAAFLLFPRRLCVLPDTLTAAGTTWLKQVRPQHSSVQSPQWFPFHPEYEQPHTATCLCSLSDLSFDHIFSLAHRPQRF